MDKCSNLVWLFAFKSMKIFLLPSLTYLRIRVMQNIAQPLQFKIAQATDFKSVAAFIATNL